jgi:hypothetical protein
MLTVAAFQRLDDPFDVSQTESSTWLAPTYVPIVFIGGIVLIALTVVLSLVIRIVSGRAAELLEDAAVTGLAMASVRSRAPVRAAGVRKWPSLAGSGRATRFRKHGR